MINTLVHDLHYRRFFTVLVALAWTVFFFGYTFTPIPLWEGSRLFLVFESGSTVPMIADILIGSILILSLFFGRKMIQLNPVARGAYVREKELNEKQLQMHLRSIKTTHTIVTTILGIAVVSLIYSAFVTTITQEVLVYSGAYLLYIVALLLTMAPTLIVWWDKDAIESPRKKKSKKEV